MGRQLLIFVLATMIVIVKGDVLARAKQRINDNSRYCAVETAYVEALRKIKNGVHAIFNLLNRLERDLTSGKEFECGKFTQLIQSTKAAASTVINNGSDIKWNVITMLRPESSSAVQKYRKKAAALATEGFDGMFLTMELIAGNERCEVQDRIDTMESNAIAKFANFDSQYFKVMQEGLSGDHKSISKNKYYEEISVTAIRLLHKAIFDQLKRILEKVCSPNSTTQDCTDPTNFEGRAIDAVKVLVDGDFDAFRAYGNVHEGNRDDCDISNYNH